jgi:septal ring-binding cell division protein DamX
MVTIEVGPQNRFTPGDPNRGQPTSFDPGRKVAAFRVDFDGSDLVWSLRGRTATAAAGSQRCATPTATATPTSTETATPTPTPTTTASPTGTSVSPVPAGAYGDTRDAGAP